MIKISLFIDCTCFVAEIDAAGNNTAIHKFSAIAKTTSVDSKVDAQNPVRTLS